MAELSIDPDYLRSLIVKVRALMGKDGTAVPNEASNFSDDELPPETLQVEDDDLTREEVTAQIRGLAPQERAELVALMWVGRDDCDPDDWNDLLDQAQGHREVSTEAYLLDHPARRVLARRFRASRLRRPRQRGGTPIEKGPAMTPALPD
jgi:hypothetical protein